MQNRFSFRPALFVILLTFAAWTATAQPRAYRPAPPPPVYMPPPQIVYVPVAPQVVYVPVAPVMVQPAPVVVRPIRRAHHRAARPRRCR